MPGSAQKYRELPDQSLDYTIDREGYYRIMCQEKTTNESLSMWKDAVRRTGREFFRDGGIRDANI